MVADLRLLGISKPALLTGRGIYSLCEKTGTHHDPWVIDVILGAIHYMDTGEALPWWHFSPLRKQKAVAVRKSNSDPRKYLNGVGSKP